MCHVITGNLKIISHSLIRSITTKGPEYRCPAKIDFQKCREIIAASLNEYCNRWLSEGMWSVILKGIGNKISSTFQIDIFPFILKIRTRYRVNLR